MAGNKRKYLERALSFIAIVALFLSRILFLSKSADFFDANEYVWRTMLPRIIDAMTSGHPPFHPLYLFFCTIFYKLGFRVIVATALPSAILGPISVIFFYFLVKEIFGRKIGWIASIFYAILPFVWISQITTLVDATEHIFYFASLWLWVKSLKTPSRAGYLLSLASGLFMALAAMAHTQVAFWAVAVFSLYLMVRSKFSWKEGKCDLIKFGLFCLGAAIVLPFYVYLLVLATRLGNAVENFSVRSALDYLLFNNIGDKEDISILKTVRFWLLVSTAPVAIAAIAGAFHLIFKKTKTFVALLVWGLPIVLTSIYIYENLHGRAMMLALAPTAIFAAIFISNIRKKWLGIATFVLLVFLVLAVSIPAVYKYKKLPGANEELGQLQSQVEQGGVFVSSNITRTWSNYKGEFVNFGDVGVGAKTALDKVEAALQNKKPAYVSEDALDLPQRRYDGVFYDIRSTWAKDETSRRTLLIDLLQARTLTLEKVSEHFVRAIFRVDAEDRFSGVQKEAGVQPIVFGRLISEGEPLVNANLNLYGKSFCRASADDISRLDPFACLKKWIRGERDASSRAFSDREGWFYLANPQNDAELVVGINPEQARLGSVADAFLSQKTVALQGKSVFSSENLDEIKEKIKGISESFYVLTGKENGKVKYNLFETELKIDRAKRIEAGLLPSEVGLSGGKYLETNGKNKAGYLVSGPYIDLKGGKYKATFSIRALTKTDDKAVVDIISDLGKTTLSRKEFSLSEIYGKEFKLLELEIGQNEPISRLEFRVKVPEKTKVQLDFIELEKLSG